MPELHRESDSLEVILRPDDHRRMANLCGQFDEHLRQIEKRLDIRIRSRGNRFRLTGESGSTAVGREVLQELFSLTEAENLDPERVHLCLQESLRGAGGPRRESLVFHTRRRDIRARGPNQAAYSRAMRDKDLIFGIGPAGTGKTYLAVAAAVEALDADVVRRIVLVRPAVEGGRTAGIPSR